MMKYGAPSFSRLAQGAWEIIQKAQKITLLTHEKPDGDGISACAAMDLFLQKLGKTTETVYPTPSEFAYSRQPKNVRIGKHVMIPDLIIIIDTATIKRTYFPQEFVDIPLINIDHHISNDIMQGIRCVDSVAASACEIVYRLMMLWDRSLLDKAIAEAIAMGILYDTQVFRTSMTTSLTLRTMADLMDFDINFTSLKEELLANKNPGIIKVWASFLNSVAVSPSGKSAWAVLSKKDLVFVGGALPMLVGFSNFLAEISLVDVTAIFYETEDGKTKASLRSRYSDVNALAKQFGGGGHIHAAGIISTLPLHEFVAQVTKLFV